MYQYTWAENNVLRTGKVRVIKIRQLFSQYADKMLQSSATVDGVFLALIFQLTSECFCSTGLYPICAKIRQSFG
jgi:hypothetical protein